MVVICKRQCYTYPVVSDLYAGMRVVYAVRQAEKGMQWDAAAAPATVRRLWRIHDFIDFESA